MAAGNFTVFNIAKLKLLTGIHDLDTHVIKAVLTTVTQSLDATFAGTSTDCRYADLTNEVANGNGYTTAGVTLTMSVTRSTGTVTVDASDAQWTTSTITAKYCVLYNDSATNKDLLGFVDLSSGGGSISTTAGTFLVSWNASGLFTLA